MADSQSDSNAFSVRIVSIDHYMAPPTHGLDISFSSFQGNACTHAVSLALEKPLKIDCNLYGMSHMHLSKMQFCHPVPDTFSPRKSDHISQHMDDDLHAN